MNSLRMNLEEGQKVVMEGDGDEASRTVTVKGGFGMVSFTSGTALMVELPNGETSRMSGMEIEKLVAEEGIDKSDGKGCMVVQLNRARPVTAASTETT